MYCTGKEDTNLKFKCGTCIYYKPLIKMNNKMGFEVKYCRGHCDLNGAYKQRTDTCIKYTNIKYVI